MMAFKIYEQFKNYFVFIDISPTQICIGIMALIFDKSVPVTLVCSSFMLTLGNEHDEN